MTSIAVVGGSLAGLSTVRGLRAEGYDGSITVIGEERHPPYDRPPLSKGASSRAAWRPARSRSAAPRLPAPRA
ncbi:FAD-dependent oxidoreductase [Kitasatospora sp. NBC_01250]|uniref:FAD-dependent oxidoreductase n=1 Tax=Kitasatospora sp. NBC_01250 TaxID=2903571 RepID=UPI003FA57CE2